MDRREYKTIFPELSGQLFNVGDRVMVRHNRCVDPEDAWEITAILGGEGEKTTYEVVKTYKHFSCKERRIVYKTKRSTRQQNSLLLVLSPEDERTTDCPEVPYVLVEFTHNRKEPHYQSFMVCPLCREVHMHGANKTGGGGHRVDHCGGEFKGGKAKRPGGYIMQEPPIRRYVDNSDKDFPKGWRLVDAIT